MAAAGVSRSMVLTLLGFCVSVLFIVFVCSRLACALLRRRRGRARLRRASPLAVSGVLSIYVDRHGHHQPSSAAGAASGTGGLDPAAVAAFPTRAFSPAASSSASASTQCVVCLAEYEEKDVLRVLPYCGHGFHVACIDIWLMHHSTCPVCRISLCDYPDSKHTMSPVPSAVIIPLPPCSPEASRSDQCNCLFVGTGHSPRTSQVLRNEPDQVKLPVILETSTQGDPWIAVIGSDGDMISLLKPGASSGRRTAYMFVHAWMSAGPIMAHTIDLNFVCSKHQQQQWFFFPAATGKSRVEPRDADAGLHSCLLPDLRELALKI
ncbi:RING-H2 finger protein ATL2 [Oryza sativa Japonica Group]|uniref:RING-type E3 ubiquitin transferase n=3 Tax=Oryza TaxID=4527 RepID=Q2QXP1_ORYSJ|nr:Zinc finger, C3HC4 type family protein, expressed [Oryza sativa Japonica Group]USH99900.1 putative RING-H2 finger protein [Oryza sativa Japonica Group]